jgi:hypothetical protein
LRNPSALEAVEPSPPSSGPLRECAGEAVMSTTDVRDLETRGFVVIPSFISEAELRVCREDYASQPVGANRNYRLSPVGGAAHGALLERVRQVLAAVTATTSLHVDLPLGGSYFATGRGIQFGWHQDHESFFAIQNHYDYLNFYIPIQKPRRDKSNLCIVPFDVLEKECPRTYRTLVRGGAANFVRMGRRTLVFLDDTGSLHLMPRDLDRLAHTPELDPGDLLLLRGDMIHRTQDTETERVSLSFRAANSETLVERSRLVDGGPMKAIMMMNDADNYERMFLAFDATGRRAVRYAELRETISGIRESPDMGRKKFFKLLLREKRRERVLLRFFRKSFTSTAAYVAAAMGARRSAV